MWAGRLSQRKRVRVFTETFAARVFKPCTHIFECRAIILCTIKIFVEALLDEVALCPADGIVWIQPQFPYRFVDIIPIKSSAALVLADDLARVVAFSST